MNISSRKSNSKSRKLRALNKTNVYRRRSLNTIYENEYIDADFIHNHPKNMVRIREALKESGKYKINKENVDNISEYEDLMDDVQETNRLIDVLESHRCPSSFYKTGLLKLI